MSAINLTDEPCGKYFYPQPDLYCGYCNELIEPEFQVSAPCHLCGEWRYLYEIKGGKAYMWCYRK